MNKKTEKALRKIAANGWWNAVQHPVKWYQNWVAQGDIDNTEVGRILKEHGVSYQKQPAPGISNTAAEIMGMRSITGGFNLGGGINALKDRFRPSNNTATIDMRDAMGKLVTPGVPTKVLDEARNQALAYRRNKLKEVGVPERFSDMYKNPPIVYSYDQNGKPTKISSSNAFGYSQSKHSTPKLPSHNNGFVYSGAESSPMLSMAQIAKNGSPVLSLGGAKPSPGAPADSSLLPIIVHEGLHPSNFAYIPNTGRTGSKLINYLPGYRNPTIRNFDAERADQPDYFARNWRSPRRQYLTGLAPKVEREEVARKMSEERAKNLPWWKRLYNKAVAPHVEKTLNELDDYYSFNAETGTGVAQLKANEMLANKDYKYPTTYKEWLNMTKERGGLAEDSDGFIRSTPKLFPQPHRINTFSSMSDDIIEAENRFRAAERDLANSAPGIYQLPNGKVGFRDSLGYYRPDMQKFQYAGFNLANQTMNDIARDKAGKFRANMNDAFGSAIPVP